jgi:tetratricopeptide (TPR) repeat protein
MRKNLHTSRSLSLGVLCFVLFGLFAPKLSAQDAASAITKETIAELDKELNEAKAASSEARQRLSVRRVIGNAEDLVAAHANDNSRFLALEFLFRAYQRLIALDKDPENRKVFLETCRELVKAPDDLAELRLEADLLLSQAELAKQGASAEARAKALRPLVERYANTPVGAKVLRMAMTMALELGDNRLVTDIQEMIEQRFSGDLEMIAFQRDKLGGQVLGAPFSGVFQRSDGKTLRFPMDGLGRSTILIFWSKENKGEEVLKGVAAAALQGKDTLAGRLEIISCNLDGLPDAGESVVRGLGVDWQVLRIPDGKKNPIYNAFVREDPRMLTMSPTGYTALIMSGTGRTKAQSDGAPDYGHMLGSSLARSWTEPNYVMQLSSLFAGDFLVFDPEGKMDPTRPPELKAFAMGEKPQPLARAASSVPEETLQAIQAAFVAPPLRYRLSHADARASYGKAVELCRKAIKDHPEAPDLWIVRNRLIIALMGLWKTDADLGKFQEAVTEAKAALAAGYPPGCDVIARFCIAREALRDPAANAQAVISKLVADGGGDKASGAVLSVAALLSLDVADRKGFEDYRKNILKNHTESPMIWTFSAFLLDRHHSYWLFQVPFTAGWSYGRREGYFQTKGDPEEANRILRTELTAGEGKPMRIPDDLDSNWTAIVFAKPAPWSSKKDDGLPASPKNLLKSFIGFAASRPAGDLKVVLASLGGDVEASRAGLDDPKNPKNKVDCPILTVPGGMDGPLVHRLGILSENSEINSVLVNKDGRIALMVSGLLNQGRHDGSAILNVVMRGDENAISAALDRGDIEAAKDKIFTLAPPFDPNAVDAKGRKLPKPPATSLAHLRARARVYMALKEWDKALADAEEVVQRQLGTDGGMSLRTDELDASELLRDTIKELRAKSEK